jgi:hypothetical protein
LLHARSGTATPLALNIPEGVYSAFQAIESSRVVARPTVSRDVVEPTAHVAARKSLV